MFFLEKVPRPFLAAAAVGALIIEMYEQQQYKVNENEIP